MLNILINQFTASRKLLQFSALVNVFFIILLVAMNDRSLYLFIAATSVAFYAHLIVMAISQGEEKRNRYYAQLPVTPDAAFAGGWLLVLTWLTLQTGIWLLFGLLFDRQTVTSDPLLLPEAALSVVFMLAIVSIAIDLFNFRPSPLRWAYLAMLAGLAVLTVQGDFYPTVRSSGDDFVSFIDALQAPWGIVAVSLASVVLIWVDHFVFTHSENYLG